MSNALGEEFIRIRPDTSTFRAELQAQIAGAMPAVQGQLAAAQAQLTRAATGVSAGGVVLPASVRSVQAQTAAASAAQAAATQRVGNASRATRQQLEALSDSTRRSTQVTSQLRRDVSAAESAVGRYSRGMLAATAASTGFFRAVSFASGAFLLGAAIGATIGAAVNEFTQMTAVGAQTVQLIKATGAAANVTATQVDALARNTLRLTGVDDELVKQSANVLLTFRAIRNEAGAGNDIFNRAVKATLDISSVFRTDLRGSAVQLGKALQDPVRGVTALRRSGISLTQSQRDLIKEMVESGRILQAQRLILGEIERQVGGTAEAIGRTLPGRLRRMREEAVNSLGQFVQRATESRRATELFTHASQGLAQASHAVASVIRTIGPGLLDVASGLGRTVQALGGFGVILGAAAAYKAVGLATSVATRATALYAAASAGAAQATLAQATANGLATVALERRATAEIAAARSAQASLAAMTALAGVFAIGAAASGHWVLALGAAAVALTGIATKAIAARAALIAAGTAVTASRVAMAALGGPVGIAAIGVGALVLALIRLRHAAANAPGSLNATRRAIDELNKSLDTNMRLRAAVGTARERLGVARFDEQAAARDLERARAAQARTTAAPGSLRARFLAEQVAEAQDKLAKAHRAVADAQGEVDAAQERARIHEQGRPAEISRITEKMLEQINAITRGRGAAAELNARMRALTEEGLRSGLSFADATTRAQRLLREQVRGGQLGAQSVQNVIRMFDRLSTESTGASRAAAAAILTIATQLDRVPTEREVSVIIDLAQRGVRVNEILNVLDSLRRLPQGRQQIVIDMVQRGASLDQILARLREMGVLNRSDSEQRVLQSRAVQQLNRDLTTQHQIALGILRTERKKLATLGEERQKRRDALDTAQLERQAARDAVESARESRDAAIEGLANAQHALGEAHTNLADTIRQANESIAQAIRSAHEALNESIQDAKSNLQDLGRAIAEALGRFAEAGATATGKISPAFQRLREQILRGEGGPETQRAAQEVIFRLRAQRPELDTDKITQQFDDLVDSFARGKITLPQFNRQFDALTKGLNIKRFEKQFGSSAANALRDEIRTFRRQGALIARSPERAGAAIVQKLVNPLRVLAQGTKDIANARREAGRDIRRAEENLSDATHAVVRAERDIVKANRQLEASERRLRQAQHKELRANNGWLRENAKWTKQLAKVEAARLKWEGDPTTKNKTKPQNTDGAVTGGLVEHGALMP